MLIERRHSLTKLEYGTTFDYVLSASDCRLVYAWWCSQEWLQDYNKFVIVPGVCIDEKRIANRFSPPLIKMNGRICTGRLRLYAEGFVDTEDENAFYCFYSSVMKHFRHTPKFLATDMAARLINAMYKTTLETNVILDDDHLNKNKKRFMDACM